MIVSHEVSLLSRLHAIFQKSDKKCYQQSPTLRQLHPLASKSWSSFSKASSCAVNLSFQFQDPQNFPSPAVYQDVCDSEIPGVLKSVFSTPQPSFPILPVHASIAAPNKSPSFFQAKIVQVFTKTFPSLIYQDFINPIIILLPLILRTLCYPFAQTQVSLSSCFYTSSTMDCLIHLHPPPPEVSSPSEANPKHAGRRTKNPKRKELAGVNYTLYFWEALKLLFHFWPSL